MHANAIREFLSELWRRKATDAEIAALINKVGIAPIFRATEERVQRLRSKKEKEEYGTRFQNL